MLSLRVYPGGMMSFITAKRIEKMIHVIRGQKVMLDSDLAELYEVETRILNRNVKRNIEKFPKDFMFQLTQKEWDNLRSQFGISRLYGGRRYPPYAFTEYGIAALSGVLNSDVATKVNIAIIKTFVNLRKLLDSDESLTEKVAKLENDSNEMKNVFRIIFEKFDQLEMKIPLHPKDRKKIGLK
jgi:hypothetical protein